MNSVTKKKLTSPTQSDLTSGNACWETPPAVFAKLQADFGPFDIDLTADGQRHLCPVWFGPDSEEGTDALTANWTDWGSSGFSNPPYGRFVAHMLEKARLMRVHGFETTLLLPMRVTNAFKAHVMGSPKGFAFGADELLFCSKRLCFFENGVPRLNKKALSEGRAVADAAVFNSIIVRYAPCGAFSHMNVGVWTVPPHVFQADLDRAVARIGDSQ